MSAWLHNLQRLIASQQRCVLVTIAGTRGSTPRETGAKMIVTPTESLGTIGGGQLEYQSVRMACDWLRDEYADCGRSHLQRFVLGAQCGQCCGGVAEVLFEEIGAAQAGWVDRLVKLQTSQTAAVIVTPRQSRTVMGKAIVTAEKCHMESAADDWQLGDAVITQARGLLKPGSVACQETNSIVDDGYEPLLFEPLAGAGFHVVVFGAGHVGSACAQALAPLEARIDLVDSRGEMFTARYPGNVQALHLTNPAQLVEACPTACYYLVMTHDHALDLEICARILKRGDFAFCGLIGSVSKRRRFEKRLRALGLGDANVAALTCPIGLPEVGRKQPAQIAIAVAAQLLRVREQVSATHVDKYAWQHGQM